MKRILAIILFSILCACTTSSNLLSGLPQWYVSPKQNNLINLYGVGEGYTLEEASNSALKNLASKLMVSISAQTTTLAEENNFDISEESRQKITEVVEKITFTNYRVSNTEQKGQKIYAEVAVDRAKFIEESAQKLSDLNKRMEEIYNNSENKNILEKRNSLAKILDLAAQATSLNYIISGLDNDFNKKRNLDKYYSYQIFYDEILEKIEFYIEPNSTSQEIIDAFSQALSKQKMKVAKSKDNNNLNLVIINLKSNLVTNKIYGSHISKLKINVELLSSQNKILANNLIEVIGNSVISSEESISAAASNLTDKINQEGILKILAIETKETQNLN